MATHRIKQTYIRDYSDGPFYLNNPELSDWQISQGILEFDTDDFVLGNLLRLRDALGATKIEVTVGSEDYGDFIDPKVKVHMDPKDLAAMCESPEEADERQLEEEKKRRALMLKRLREDAAKLGIDLPAVDDGK